MRTPRAIASTLPILLIVAWLATAPPAFARPSQAPAIPIVNVSRWTGNQTENTIAVNPTNPSNIVVASNTDSTSGLFRAYSFDGGITWTGGIIANGGVLGVACCDVSMAFDGFGNLFMTYLFSTNGRVPVAVSTDGGVTFSIVSQIQPTSSTAGTASPTRGLRPGDVRAASSDQPTITTGAGSVWVTYTSEPSGRIQAAGAPVTGLGQVGAFIAPENAGGTTNVGDYGDIAVGPTGQVLVVYQNPSGGQGPAAVYSDLDPDGLGPLGFDASRLITVTNVGGFDYIPAQAGRSVDAEANISWDRSGGPHTGRVYLEWTQETPDESSNMDIMAQYSDDQGTTWSTAVRVNRDAGANSQFNPAIEVDQTTGRVAISWYDCRNDRGQGGIGDTNGVPNDDAMEYAALSTNGGVTWSKNVRIAARASNSADAFSSIDYGDYESMAFFGGDLYPAWADNSNTTGDNPNGRLHQLDLYTARIHVG